MMRPSFELRFYDLKCATLGPLKPESIPHLGLTMSQMPPWSTIGLADKQIMSNLEKPISGLARFEIRVEKRLAGLVCIHSQWLHGPYLQLIAICPEYQSQGIGLRILEWMELEARKDNLRQLWLCVSTFNDKACAFYKRFGFELVGEVDGLVIDSFSDYLMRKRLYVS